MCLLYVWTGSLPLSPSHFFEKFKDLQRRRTKHILWQLNDRSCLKKEMFYGKALRLVLIFLIFIDSY